jgi:hypothetical protein
MGNTCLRFTESRMEKLLNLPYNYGFTYGPSGDLLLCIVATDGHHEDTTSLNVYTMNVK